MSESIAELFGQVNPSKMGFFLPPPDYNSTWQIEKILQVKQRP